MSTRRRAMFAGLGAAVMAGAAGTAVVAAQPSHGDSVYYSASFGRAGQGLDAKSDIKVRGITVGNVESVKLDPDGRVSVRMRVDRGVQIPKAVEARIDPVSMFGPKEVHLESAGTDGPYLSDGDVIAKTKDPADPSETAEPAYTLSKAINPQDVTSLVHTFSQGLTGQGPTLRRTLDNGAKVIDRSYANREVVRQLVGDVAGLGDTLGGRGDALARTSRNAGDLSAVISGKPDKFGQLLDQAGALSSQVGDTLHRQGGNLGGLIDDTGKTASMVAGQNQNVGELMASLNNFFSGLGGAMNAPGPNGFQPATLRGHFPLDFCQIIVDVCPPGKPPRQIP